MKIDNKISIYKWVIIFGFIMVIGFLVYTRSRIKEDIFYPLASKAPAPSPYISAMLPCQKSAVRHYSLSTAISDPLSVCNLIISTDRDMEELGRRGNLFKNLELLTIKDVSKIYVAYFPSILTLHILDIGIEDDEDSEAENTNETIEIPEEDEENPTIPAEIGKLATLTTLYIASTNLEKLPPEIGNLNRLNTILLRSNPYLKIFPASAAKLSSITTLAFHDNPNLKIPDSLLVHQSLENITIAGGNITKIPLPVYQLRGLSTLAYMHNKIGGISKKISNLTSLRVLNLSNNKLSQFPDIGKLKNLQELDLSFNQLTWLPAGIERLRGLKILRLSNNSLGDDTLANIQKLTELSTLDLGYNKLTDIPPGIEKLNNLIYLRLTGNKIDIQKIEDLKIRLPRANIVM